MSKEMNTDTVGARIREKRKDKGFSQEKLADLLMIKQLCLSMKMTSMISL